MKLIIDLPPDLRQRVLLVKDSMAHAAANIAQARQKADREISSFEQTASDLSIRIEKLKLSAISENSAAAELAHAERRLALILPHMDRLKTARNAAPGVNDTEVKSVFLAVLIYWENAVQAAARKAFEPFGVPAHLLPLFLANLESVATLRQISDIAWEMSLRRKLEILDSALAGNVNLNDPAPPDAAPAAGV